MDINFKNVSFIYGEKTPFEKLALDNIDLTIKKGEFVGIIGHTGSGKSTLIQHFNGILKPTSGDVFIGDMNTKDKTLAKSGLRYKIGLVFQYPEYQLFEETIEKDIAFGPRNMGLSEEEVTERVKEAMELVGLDYETKKDKSPFEISGGQKRRVAIAGILAMKPDILILDEPTAGLDPKGRDELFFQIKNLYEKNNITIVLISHSMEDVAKLVNRIIIMKDGHIHLDKKTKEAFSDVDDLKKVGLNVPQITELMDVLRKNGHNFSKNILTVDEAFSEIKRELRNN
ncbi:energy-coupling factor transporter ATPase [Parvimonas micra]|jgi:cobalt import ATP-binding protein cbiO 2|uniref:energy-coupling factor transporter ATPase n=1 Tax=Parvimonas TaxID=543311 RepID=UPI001E30FD09|nr:energy-coupling factor transporter ATPase [Parvimonas micra]MCE3019348.1 energy-coupling factor transporter ATPase [Parvimonas micra]